MFFPIHMKFTLHLQSAVTRHRIDLTQLRINSFMQGYMQRNDDTERCYVVLLRTLRDRRSSYSNIY
jgi:hypothetical protein